jgi:hypothetical protein
MAEQVEVYLKGAESIFVSAEDSDKIEAAISSRQATVEVRELNGNATVLILANVVRLEKHPGRREY